MDAVLLTWRWQNLFAVGVMVVFWLLAFSLATQWSIRQSSDQQQ